MYWHWTDLQLGPCMGITLSCFFVFLLAFTGFWGWSTTVKEFGLPVEVEMRVSCRRRVFVLLEDRRWLVGSRLGGGGAGVAGGGPHLHSGRDEWPACKWGLPFISVPRLFPPKKSNKIKENKTTRAPFRVCVCVCTWAAFNWETVGNVHGRGPGTPVVVVVVVVFA